MSGLSDDALQFLMGDYNPTFHDIATSNRLQTNTPAWGVYPKLLHVIVVICYHIVDKLWLQYWRN